MSQVRAEFCTACGAPFAPDAAFCTTCGAARATVSAPGSANQPARTPAANTHAFVAHAAGVGAGAMATVLPWQTIVAGETPDLRAMLASVTAPAARRVAQASLRKPGLSLAVTTVLDVVVAWLSGGSSALVAALPRAFAGGLSAVLSLATGSGAGALRTVTGLVSALTALVQAGSLVMTLVGGLTAGSPLLALVPMVIATASALTMAIKTASVALRRRS